MRILFLLSALLFAPLLQAEEKILSFESEIAVNIDGSQRVTETIRVIAAGRSIKRGIYRDFPTRYSANGRPYNVRFQVVEVRRDGKPEAWHTERLSNGIRVYMGRSHVFLEPGEYTYKLTYITDRQLGFFESHDELYWNVTGNGWVFPIEYVSATVILPSDIPLSQVSTIAYTGAQGGSGSDYRSERLPYGLFFESTRTLGSYEGMTIVAGWPKGHVLEPTWQDELHWRWRDEPGLFIVWLGFLTLLAYYLFAWFLVGRDPKAGVIMPLYEPPSGYSPAAIRLIRRMGYDDKATSAALVSLAVKGAIRIKEDDDEYSVTPTDQSADGLTPDEYGLLSEIGSSKLTFKNSNHQKVSRLIEAHEEKLDTQYRKKYFYANRGWVLPGWLITAIVLGWTGWASIGAYGPEAFVFIFIFGFLLALITPFLRQLWKMRKPYRRTFTDWLSLAGSSVPMLFIGGIFEAGELSLFLDVLPWQMLAGVAAVVFTNILYNYLIKAPTLNGRKLLDRIEGFRQYLGLAEGDELKARYAGPLTREKFEAYLPYAIALDVETQWSERFSSELRRAGKDPGEYRSHWYDGSDFRGVRGLCTSVSTSLASSVSSSSVAPGSSSGGGGGGFSGGGGGGGGGGGW